MRCCLRISHIKTQEILVERNCGAEHCFVYTRNYGRSEFMVVVDSILIGNVQMMKLNATLNPVKQIGGIAGGICSPTTLLCNAGHLSFYGNLQTKLKYLSGAGQDLQRLN